MISGRPIANRYQATISEWLARPTAPDGTAMVMDLELSLVEADVPNLELRGGGIAAGPVAPGDFDLVTAGTWRTATIAFTAVRARTPGG
jgi:hypothetical protein